MPGEDGSDDERAALEDKHTSKITAALRAIMRRVAPPGTTVDNIAPDIAIRRYREASSLLRDVLVAMLTDGVLLGVDAGRQHVERAMGVTKAATIAGVDWDLVNADALRWVLGSGDGFGTGYTDSLEQALAQTSERLLRPMIAEWMQNNLSYDQLVQQLSRVVFSEERASRIAVTEITRAFYRGNMEGWRGSKVIRRKRFNSANDENVCPICQPLNQQVVALDETWNGYEPPLHVKCRCWASPVVDVPD